MNSNLPSASPRANPSRSSGDALVDSSHSCLLKFVIGHGGRQKLVHWSSLKSRMPGSMGLGIWKRIRQKRGLTAPPTTASPTWSAWHTSAAWPDARIQSCISSAQSSAALKPPRLSLHDKDGRRMCTTIACLNSATLHVASGSGRFRAAVARHNARPDASWRAVWALHRVVRVALLKPLNPSCPPEMDAGGRAFCRLYRCRVQGPALLVELRPSRHSSRRRSRDLETSSRLAHFFSFQKA